MHFRYRTPTLLAVAVLGIAGVLDASADFTVRLTGGQSNLDGTVDVPADIEILPLFADPDDPPTIISTTLPIAFDTDDPSWGIGVSYRVTPRVEIELDYLDVGAFESVTAASGPVVIPVTGGPSPFLPPPLGGVAIRNPSPSQLDVPRLLVNTWSTGIRGETAINEMFRAFGRVGMSWTEFRVRAGLPGTTFTAPNDEIGWYWGVGVNYPVSDRASIGVGFEQQHVDLQTVDRVALTLEARLF